jgi:predicted nucleic acid-binding protein
MLLGADTGFFVAYANNHPRALEIWQQLISGLHTLVVSTLTISEILVYFYQRGEGDKGQEWVELMTGSESIQVAPVSIGIAARSAGYRHGLGLPTVDAVILSTFVERACDRMLTTDSHFHIANEQKVLEIEN